MKIDDEVVDLERWDAIRIPAAATRCLEGGPEGAEVIAVGAPNTQNKDAEVLPGWWED